MTDEFRLRLEEKKKEIDDYISKAKKDGTRDIFSALREELEKIRTPQDLDERISVASEYKKQAKKDSTRVAFDVLEKELRGLRESLPEEILAARKGKPEAKPLLRHSIQEISRYIMEGEPDIAVADVVVSKRKPKEPAREKTLSERVSEVEPHMPLATLEIKEHAKQEKEKTRPKPVKKHLRKRKVGRKPHRPARRPRPVTLKHIHRRISRRRRKPPKKMAEADARLQKMSNLVVKMPELRMSLQELEGEMQGHRKAVSELKSSEDELHGNVKEVMDSLSGLRDHVVDKMAKQKMEKEEADRLLEKTGETINAKVNVMSKKLDEALKMLSSRIDETSKIGKLQMESNIQFLRNQIEQMRKDMPKPAGKKAIRKAKKKRGKREKLSLEAQPGEREIAEAAKHVKKPVEKPKEEATDEKVQIADLKHFRGKEVILDVELELTKAVEEDGMNMYGYTLKDKTGEIMLTSTREIKDKKARVKCAVNETLQGRLYLRFLGLA
jgi:hypothetical protein